MNPQKSRIIPAYRFKAQLLGDDQIEEYVNDILQCIEEDMRCAIENEKTACKTEVPVTFAVSGMTNARAQKHIYFHTINALTESEYVAKIEIGHKVYIHVTWLSNEDREFESYMDKFIAQHQVKTNQPLDIRSTKKQKPISRRRK